MVSLYRELVDKLRGIKRKGKVAISSEDGKNGTVCWNEGMLRFQF